MLDVLIAGAGPAGSIAALVLARAGARVLIVDRESFPRDKLCGDTVNPGAIDLLASLGLVGGPLERGQPLKGMILSGPRVSVSARYGDSVAGRVVRRFDLDGWLLDRAIAAGAKFESALVVRQPLLAGPPERPVVRGLVLASRGSPGHVSRMPATMVIAADGSRSVLGRALNLVRTPPRPRRWAFGAYASGIEGVADLGEMHVRSSSYLGIAPLGNGLANVCVVTGPRPDGREPLEVMRRVIDADARLAARFRNAMFVEKPRVLGPLAVEAAAAGVSGMLLAGDAAGFVDPMTGDGLRLAMQGAVLAAQEALRALDSSEFGDAPRRLQIARQDAMGGKLRFNRLARAVAGSRTAVGLISCGAAIVPGLMSPVIRYAGDVRLKDRSRPQATGSLPE